MVCIQHYLTLTRISELAGIQSTNLFKDFMAVLVNLVPNFLSQPQTALDGKLLLDPAVHGHYPTAHGTLWSYTYTCKPWMPSSYSSYSREPAVAFDLVKADRIMNMMDHADSRLIWRWCGIPVQDMNAADLDTNTVIQTPLFQALLQQTHQHPEKLLSRKLVASLLFQTSQSFPRFYTASSHRHFIDTVSKEELPLAEDSEEVSGWDTLDLDILPID
jgi:hypothetical protein